MVNSHDYLRQVDGLEINQVEDGFVIYDTGRDKVHYLNHTAVFVLELCNGRHTAAEIPDIVSGVYGLDKSPEAAVSDILERFIEEGLVRS